MANDSGANGERDLDQDTHVPDAVFLDYPDGGTGGPVALQAAY
jgi:hypothetical protein